MNGMHEHILRFGKLHISILRSRTLTSRQNTGNGHISLEMWAHNEIVYEIRKHNKHVKHAFYRYPLSRYGHLQA